MLKNIVNTLLGSHQERFLKRLLPMLHAVNEKEAWAIRLKAEEFPRVTTIFKERLAAGESMDSLLPEAFALAREASRRILGERPYDVQVLGSIVLHQGKIAELKTGEGKTLMIVAAAYLNALSGNGVHIATTNDYLARRDADWMRPVFEYLGMTVGIILSDMNNERRKVNYDCDVTYGTNNEFGFDYLRDNMHEDMENQVQRGHYYCVVDEIDSILIDEARTPLIISEAAEDDAFKYAEINKLLNYLEEVHKGEDGEYPSEAQGQEVIGDYKLNEKDKNVTFTSTGLAKIGDILNKRGLARGTIVDKENYRYIHYFTQLLKAHKLYRLDVDYVVRDGKVQIVDEFTGRILHGRRYSDGLHQAIEAKECVRIAQRNRTKATITFQNYFRLYKKIAGGTGTAATEAMEFLSIYGLEVVVVPTNLPVVRVDENDELYLNEKDKYAALCDEIVEINRKGQPVLVGTDSIERSEMISVLLTRRGVRHEVLNAKNHMREASIIAEAGAKGAVTIATNMAGRGTDIKLGGNPKYRTLQRAGSDASTEKHFGIYEEEYEKWLKGYEEVKSLGGLYVIGTVRHESRRIDNQLRGRSGRQGDPGRSKFFVSMDDDLMRHFGGEKMKRLMMRIGMEPGEPIYNPLLSRSIEGAQKKVEERNFDFRKKLLEYDDVLNQQRKFIYRQRNAILTGKNFKDVVNEVTADITRGFINEFIVMFRQDLDAAQRKLAENLNNKFGYIFRTSENEITIPEYLEKRILQDLNQNIDDKEALIGTAYFDMIVRSNYIHAVDRKWLEHLENMEALRGDNRNYSQMDPLTAYKVEGFQIFEIMLDDIRMEVASRMHLIRIQVAPPSEERSHRPSRTLATSQSASHSNMDLFGAAALWGPGGTDDQKPAPKIERNDPCPCGSGRKYKHCHGK